MKVYYLQPDRIGDELYGIVHGKPYTWQELNTIQDRLQVNIFIAYGFHEFETENVEEEELEVELGMLRKYGQTTLHGVRTTINPLYPTFRFTLYVCSERAGKVYSTKWLAQLPLWLRTMLPNDMNGPVIVKDFATTFQVFVKDEQRVWDIMEKMHSLQCTLK